MKKILASVFSIFSALFIQAQNKGTIQLYAFEQPILTGANLEKVITEDGKEVPVENKRRFTYFIYTAASSPITPVEIWLKGKVYSASLQTLASPVVEENPTSIEKRILVPRTNKKVQQWNMKEMATAKSTSRGRSLSKTYEVVIIYKVSGRSYYQVLKTMKEIDPVAMQ